MKKLKSFLVILLFFFQVFSPVFAGGYYPAEEIDPLLMELETELTKQENLLKVQETELTEAKNELNNAKTELENCKKALKEAEKSLKKSEKENAIEKLSYGTSGFILGFVATIILSLTIIGE